MGVELAPAARGDDAATATTARVLDALRAVLDPELGLDIVALGLVYAVEVAPGEVRIQLTMTTPACPLGEQIVEDAVAAAGAVPDVGAVHVELVWDPPWTSARMEPAARAALGWRG